jgi:hypothetical protein
MKAQEENKNLRLNNMWSLKCETEALENIYSDQQDIQKL